MYRSKFLWFGVFLALVILQLGLIAHEIEHGLEDDELACVFCLSSAHLGDAPPVGAFPELTESHVSDYVAANGRRFFQFSRHLPSIRAPPLTPFGC